MKADFEIGDKVSLMDENLNGVVKAINKERVVVTIEDGFDMEVNLSQLVPFQEFEFSMGDIRRIKLEKNDNAKPKKTSKAPKKKTYIEFELLAVQGPLRRYLPQEILALFQYLLDGI